MSRKALVVIDLQTDYFPGGKFPLWQADETAARIVEAIRLCHARGIAVIHVQHLADPGAGIAPFFNPGTPGAAIHPAVLAAAPEAPVVVKHFADSFHGTGLAGTLAGLGADEILLCGMMTQNCVTHTALSPEAAAYRVRILPDLCTSVSEPIHLIALNAVALRIPLTPSAEALA